MRVPKLLCGFAIAFGLMLGGAGVAHAASYTCDGGSNPVPASVSGDADISASGACTIGHGVTATGYIHITAGGVVNTGSLTSGTALTITTSSGSITTADLSTSGSAVVLYAPGDISSNVINSSNGSTQGGDIRVFANQAGGGDPFVIGASGAANGALALESGGYSTSGAVYVENGAGITIQNPSDINVLSTGGNAGTILLDALNGNITIDGGYLSSNGSTGHAAGRIVLLANQVITSGGTIISASDTGSQVDHYVSISASTISYSGGLSMYADGDNTVQGGMFITPQGSQSYTAPTDPTQPITVGVLAATAQPLTITGSGTLAVSANGATDQVYVSGYPLTYSGQEMDVYGDGSNDHVVFTYTGSPSGMTTLAFNGGPVNVYSNGVNSKGGQVNVTADKFSAPTTSNIVLNANGDSGGNYQGGTIIFNAAQVAAPGGVVSMYADGGGTGQGGQVTMDVTSGNLPFGTAAGNYNLLAQGGPSGGNAGNVTVNGNADVKVSDPNGLFVSANSGNGNGGVLTINANTLSNVQGGNIGLFANGSGSGNGGTLHIDVQQQLDIGSAATAFYLVAQDGGTGNAGTIELTGSTINLDGGYVYLNAQSSGNGGNLTVTNTGTLNISNQFWMQANGAGNGNGGDFSLTAGAINFTGAYHEQIYANGAGSGQGGQITLNATSSSTGIKINGTDTDAVTLNANGGDTGAGGSVTLESTNGNVTIDNAALSVAAGSSGNGNGGTISVPASQNISMIGNMAADAAGNGDGGSVSMVATSNMTFTGSGQYISVNAPGTGNGGQISLTSGGPLTVNDTAGSIVLMDENTCTTCTAARPASRLRPRQAKIPTITVDSTGNPVGLYGASVLTGPGMGHDGVTITGTSATTLTLVGDLYANADPSSDGNGGNIRLTAGTSIDTTQGFVQARAHGTGNGGNISLNAPTLNMGFMDTNADVNGNGGSIAITQSGSSQLNVTGGISSDGGSASGDGGGISITTGSTSPMLISGGVVASNQVSSGNPGHITLASSAGDLNVTVQNEPGALVTYPGMVGSAPQGTLVLSPLANSNNVALTISGTGNVQSNLQSVANNIQITSNASGNLGIANLTAFGTVNIVNHVAGGAASVESGGSISAAGQVTLDVPDVYNEGTISSVYGVLITNNTPGSPPSILDNEGSIAGSTTGPIEIDAISDSVTVSGGGSLTGQNISLLATGPGSFEFAGSQSFYPSDGSVKILTANNQSTQITVDSGATIEAFAVGANNPTLELRARFVVNNGAINANQGTVEFTRTVDDLTVSGSGNIIADQTVLGVQGSEGVTVQQNAIESYNLGPGTITGQAANSWSVTTSTGGLIASSVFAGSNISVVSAGVVSSSGPITSLGGDITLNSTDGSVSVGASSNISSAGGNIYIGVGNVSEDQGTPPTSGVVVQNPTDPNVYWGSTSTVTQGL